MSPLFLITAIVLDRIVISSSQIGIGQSLRSLFILLLSALLAIQVVQYLVKDSHRSSFIVLMIPAALIAYRSSYRFLEINFPGQAHELGLALIVLIGVLYGGVVHRKMWARVRNPARLNSYFSLVCVLMLSFQLIRLGRDSYHLVISNPAPSATAVPVFGSDFKLKTESTPDMYVIILDGYARQDVLETI